MFQDMEELAENKLLLLYVLEKIKFPLPQNQLIEIILQKNLINYFTLQQYIAELIDADFIRNNDYEGKKKLSLTKKGAKVLELFQNRISEDRLKIIDLYFKDNMGSIKKQITVTADYTIVNNDNFVVNLKSCEGDTVLIDIKLFAVSNKQARDICTKWKNQSSDLYGEIINLLMPIENENKN